MIPIRVPVDTGGGSPGVPAARRYRFALPAVLCVTALTLAACGGGGGDGTPVAGAPGGEEDLVIGSSDGRAAGDVPEDELRRNAVSSASAGLGLNLGNLRRLGDDDAAPGVGAPPLPGEDPFDGDADEAGMDGDELLVALDDGSADFLRRTLGVDDPNARVTRDGDVVTIDPDDAALCSDDPSADYDDALVLDDDGTSSSCLALAADLSVTLTARTEDSGVVGYLFDGEPLLSIGYSPGGIVLELRLAGVERVLRRIETLDGLEPSGATLAGTLRWAARVFDDTPGAESGEIEISVTEALEVGDTGTEAGFSLAPSRVLLIGFDGATDEVTASVSWGALRLVAESGDSEGNRSLTTVSLGGLTLDLDADADAMSSAISLRNIGIGGVPLNIQVDSTDALTLALETFGITLDEGNGELTFDTAAGVDLMLDNVGGAFEGMALDYIARFTASAPAGTALVERDDGVFEVVGGGPFTASVDASDGTGSVQSAISAGVGSCFGSGGPESESEDTTDGTDGTAAPAGDAGRLADGLDLVALNCP